MFSQEGPERHHRRASLGRLWSRRHTSTLAPGASPVGPAGSGAVVSPGPGGGSGTRRPSPITLTPSLASAPVALCAVASAVDSDFRRQVSVAALPSCPRICPESRVHSRGPSSKHVKMKTRQNRFQNSRTGVQGRMLLSACPWLLCGFGNITLPLCLFPS